MKHPIKLKNIDEFNAYFSQPTYDPHVAIGDFTQADLSLFDPIDFSCFCVILMDNDFGEVYKNGSTLKYRSGTMFTAKPGEILSGKVAPGTRPRGKMLVFRADILQNTGLGRDFYMFNFFDFKVSDALVLTQAERRIMLNCYANIEAELKADNDEFTAHMLRLSISQMLTYCKRFYERQFDTKQFKSSAFITKLDGLLENYYTKESLLPKTHGFPTVAWCATEFHLAPNYFGNLVRRELHISAKEYIHNKIVEKAKDLLSTTDMSVEEIASALGFDYANHFSRLFRNIVGMAPSQFRKSPGKIH